MVMGSREPFAISQSSNRDTFHAVLGGPSIIDTMPSPPPSTPFHGMSLPSSTEYLNPKP